MSRVELRILKSGSTEACGKNGSSLQANERAIINKWKFKDSMMGEQFLTFTITSETPINWEVGDFCEFRGEIYTLNYIPTALQKARTRQLQDAYTYENVKFDSCQEELTRILLLDITSTTGDYVSAMGTNYTGSSKFQLFCGETSVNDRRLTAVCVLAAKIQANLDRAFPSKWNIYVDTTSTYTNASGRTEYVTHTEDKVLSFDNTTVAKALEEVHTTFNLDYCVKGRRIYIGYNLKNLTSDNADETFAFGYGKGYPTREYMNTGLFQLKRIANSEQKIVTRLRVFGSTKNLPYRYYNEKYGLSQSMFPFNLQLPNTFDAIAVKDRNNTERDNLYGINELSGLPFLRHVKGDTNDSYIDKNDDADSCSEGVREDSVYFDGSNGDLPEIFPTIEDVTFGELRGTSVKDQDGVSGFNAFPNYSDDDYINELLAIGYMDSNGNLVDDANDGDGILPENYSDNGTPILASLGQQINNFNSADFGDFTDKGEYLAGRETTLFTVEGVNEGKYALVPSNGTISFLLEMKSHLSQGNAEFGYILTIKQTSKQTGKTSTIANYTSKFSIVQMMQGLHDIALPALPDVTSEEGVQVNEIVVTEYSDVIVTVTPIIRNISVQNGYTGNISFTYCVGVVGGKYIAEYTWMSTDGRNDNGAGAFHVFIKDMGFNLSACFTGDTPMLAMKSGRCVSREFEIGKNIERVTHNGQKGYMLTLNRATDKALNTYYPSETDPIVAGDKFVLLNIVMPDAYVESAEVRLLRAATDYLADNCTTQFTYQPYIDDIYLQRNYDNMVAVGTPQNSIFWRLYAGLKFTFRGIPEMEDDPLPLIDLTIEQVTINMGDGLTPKVEMILNDDVQQTTLQKLTTSVDRIYNGSLFSSGSGGTGANAAALLSILQSEGGKMFISKRNDDVVKGKIDFENVVTHHAQSKFQKGLILGNYQPGLVGTGGMIDGKGNAEFRSLRLWEWLEVPELRYNRVSINIGLQMNTCGGGIIETVTPDSTGLNTGYITLKLEDGEYGAVSKDDYCMGIWHDTGGGNADANSDDRKGSFGFKGFKTVYFQITEIPSTDADGNSNSDQHYFAYVLRSAAEGGNGIHPFSGMHFATRGNASDEQRQSFSYYSPIESYALALTGVCSWEFDTSNYYEIRGKLDGFSMPAVNSHGETYIKTFSGYGQVFGNAYIFGHIDQFERVAYRCYIYQSLGGFLAPGETEDVSVQILNGYGEDVTAQFTLISVTRTTGDDASDALWNAEHTSVGNPFPIAFTDLGIDGIHKIAATFNVTATDEAADVAASATLEITA